MDTNDSHLSDLSGEVIGLRNTNSYHAITLVPSAPVAVVRTPAPVAVRATSVVVVCHFTHSIDNLQGLS